MSIGKGRRFESDVAANTHRKTEQGMARIVRWLEQLDEESTDIRYGDCLATARTLVRQLATIQYEAPTRHMRPSQEPHYTLTPYDQALLRRSK